MSLFRRAPRTDARQLLFDPEFACELPGVQALVVDYDPAVWTRLPTLGQDRTTWVEQVRAAYAEDLGWTTDTVEQAKVTAAADTIADTGLEYTASFVAFRPGPTDFAQAHVHVVDDERLLLEYAEPPTYLSFADVRPERPGKVQKFPQGWEYGVTTFVDPESGPGAHVRGHKAVETPGVLHLVGLGLGRGTRWSGDILSVFARSRLRLTDGSLR